MGGFPTIVRFWLAREGSSGDPGPDDPTAPAGPAGRSDDGEENYRRLFEQVPDGVYQATPSGKILLANRALIEMLGYESLEELQGLDLARDLYADPRVRSAWMEQIERQDELRDLELTLVCKDGREIVVLDSAVVVRDAGGKALYYQGTLTDITDRKRAEEAQSVLLAIFRAAIGSSDLHELLATTQKELARLIDTSNFYVALYDEQTRQYSFPFHVDKYEPSDLPSQEMPKSLTDYVRRTGSPLLVDEQIHDRLARRGEVTLVGVASPIWLGVPLKTGDEVIGVVAVQSYEERALYSQQDLEILTFVADNIAQVVQRKKAEEELRKSEVRFRALFEASPDAIFVEDRHGNVLDVNPAAEALQGIPRERLVGMNVAELVPAEEVDPVLDRHSRLVSGEVEMVEGFAYAADGRVIPVEVRSSAFEFGGLPAVLLHVHDIAERRRREERLEHLARFDALTGLPNRFLFEDRLAQAVIAGRRSEERLALHYLDLDEFKQVNDTFGHSVGDALLKAVGDRLESLVRETDTVARLGGDEFAIIQSGANGVTGASAFAVRVLEQMLKPFRAAGHELLISTSIGISLSTGAEEPEELLKQADRALYKAKDRGRGSFRFHDESLAEEVHRYVTLRRDLSGAVERREFFLEYQPQVDLASGRIVGAEALVRWRHPTRGVLPPAEFIPITEQTALMIPIGSWVLQEACRQRREWCDAGLARVPTAVNLSAVQFRDPRFADTIRGVLRETRVRPDLLELELTETLLMQGSEAVRRTLLESSRRGISIALDDFGTGYSSLQYLRQFPIHKLKIAMQFVHGVTDDPDDAAIVSAVISLGHQLGLRVLAEGVETEEQLEFLREHGCDEAQGYYFSRPVSAEEYAEKLRGEG